MSGASVQEEGKAAKARPACKTEAEGGGGGGVGATPPYLRVRLLLRLKDTHKHTERHTRHDEERTAWQAKSCVPFKRLGLLLQLMRTNQS